MKKRSFKSKALTAAERRASLDSFVLTGSDDPVLPSWWPAAPMNTAAYGSATDAYLQRTNATADHSDRLLTANSPDRTRSIEPNAANDAVSADDHAPALQSSPLPNSWATQNSTTPDREVVPPAPLRAPLVSVVACGFEGAKHCQSSLFTK